jgi:enhancing lycopene biosynthesis protein 2|tara:strand:+ start:267 stop:929 length:663 start_codon:yes stop_codon:yes gene_type:complete
VNKKVAVVLSGCGVFDGSEVYEAVITLLCLDKLDLKVQCFAPDIQQMHVVDHLNGNINENDTRNVLVESARLVRGDIKNLAEAREEDFDAVLIPGGFGAAKNLSNFSTEGPNLLLNEDLKYFVQAMHRAKKPVGAMCIAPAMVGILFGKGAVFTIGNDKSTAESIEKTGAIHKICGVDEICIDEDNILITTPAYMLANRISEAAAGIEKLVVAVYARIKH